MTSKVKCAECMRRVNIVTEDMKVLDEYCFCGAEVEETEDYILEQLIEEQDGGCMKSRGREAVPGIVPMTLLTHKERTCDKHRPYPKKHRKNGVVDDDFLESSGIRVLTADKPEDIDKWPSFTELFGTPEQREEERKKREAKK
jgi:hypothetical protein